MAGTLSLRIVAPEGDVLKEEVEFVVLPGVAGELGILPHHSPLISGLDCGVIRYTKNGIINKVSITAGFAEVVDNTATILADAAESCERIDVQRALEAKERAEKRLTTPSSEIDLRRAEYALRRASTRLSASNYKK